MSSNLDVVRGVYAAFAVGDIPAVLAVFSQDIHWTEAAGGPYGGVYVGPNAVLENVFMKLGEYSGAYKATGKSFKAPFAHVWKFREGKAASFHQYTDTAVHRNPLQA